MINEIFYSTILQASITGAGLILAVYGLIIPLFDKIAAYRIKSINELIKRIKSTKDRDLIFKSDSIEEARNSLNYLEEIRKLPSYFSRIVTFTFLSYIITTLFSMWWLLDWHKDFMGVYIPWTFGISCTLFAYVGSKTIKDLIDLIKYRYETRLKKQIKK